MPDARHETPIVTGLKNAHAPENQALFIMRPQVARRLEQHIAETEVKLHALTSC